MSRVFYLRPLDCLCLILFNILKGSSGSEVRPSDPAPGEPSVFLQCSPVSENATSADGTEGSCCGSGPAQPFFSFLCKNNVSASQNDLNLFSRRDSGSSFFRNISSLENLCCSEAKCEMGEPKPEGKCWFCSELLYSDDTINILIYFFIWF